MSQVFHDIAQFKHFTDLNLLKRIQRHSKLRNKCLTILLNGVYFLLAVKVEGDESNLECVPKIIRLNRFRYVILKHTTRGLLNSVNVFLPS